MTEDRPVASGRLESLQKLFKDLFSVPVDAFDFYHNTNILGFWNIFGFHLILWCFAPLSKLFFNFIQIKFLMSNEESGLQMNDGLLIPSILYPVLYFLGFLLELFRKNFKQANSIEINSFSGIGNISFLAISSTSFFWILPKPINFIFLILGIFYSVKLYYSSVMSFDSFSRKDFYKLLLYFFIFLGILSFIFILIGNSIRGNV